MVINNCLKKISICTIVTVLIFSVFTIAEVHTFTENIEAYCNTVSSGPNSVTISLAVPEIALDKRDVNGVEYLCPIRAGYRNNLQEGAPAVLVNYFSILTGPNPNLDIRIIFI